MSKISDMGVDFSELPTLVETYETDLMEAAANVKITGKLLDLALREQGSWPLYYSQRRAELKTLVKYLDAKVSAVRGSLAKRYVENYNPKIGERVMNSYIDSEPEYLKMYRLYLEISDLYERYNEVCEAFTIRGFALRDITLARSNQIENT